MQQGNDSTCTSALANPPVNGKNKRQVFQSSNQSIELNRIDIVCHALKHILHVQKPSFLQKRVC